MTPPSIRWRTPTTTTNSNSMTKTPGNPFSAKIYMVSLDRVAGPATTVDSVSHNRGELGIRLPYPENPLKHNLITNFLYIPHRVGGPDTTTDSLSHNSDDLGIKLPDPKNPLKHFFITN
jgi:hypothetical protein